MIAMRDIHWLAGLLEGEGCFYTPAPGVKGAGRSLQLRLGMTDRDVVERAASLMKTSVRSQKSTGKPVFTTVANSNKAAGWMMTLYSLMGERRQGKIRECISWWKERTRSKKLCVRGHAYSDVYTNADGSRQCRPCVFIHNKAKRAVLKAKRDGKTAEVILPSVNSTRATKKLCQ